MQANIGKTEKIIRIIVGVAIIVAGIIFQSWWGAIGAIPLITGLINYCPAWSIFGINTRKTAQD
jgi:hypothetical protein